MSTLNELRRMHFNEAMSFQECELSKLANLSIEELRPLSGRRDIDSPAGLEFFDFAVEIKESEFADLEVAVFHYTKADDNEGVSAWLLEMMERAGATFGEARYRRWFDMFSDGRIEWPSFEHDDND